MNDNRLRTETEWDTFLPTDAEDGGNKVEKQHFLGRLKTEKRFRHRIIHTTIVYWSFIAVVYFVRIFIKFIVNLA